MWFPGVVGHAHGHERADELLGRARTCLEEGRIDQTVIVLRQVIAELENGGSPDGEVADLLTRSELRVARMAADGMKNREIAEELTVTLKAVEFHLANTYRKLSIGSRTELTRFFNWVAPVLTSVVAAG